MAREVTRRLITASASNLGNWSSPLEPGSAYQLSRFLVTRKLERITERITSVKEIIVLMDQVTDDRSPEPVWLPNFVAWELIPYQFLDLSTGGLCPPAATRRSHFGRS